MTQGGHWVTARGGLIDPRTPFGTPGMPGTGPTSGLGFYAIQNIATI
jgi:hypothetical protein